MCFRGTDFCIVEGLACLTRLNGPIRISVRELPLWKFGMRATLDVDPSWLLFCDETFCVHPPYELPSFLLITY